MRHWTKLFAATLLVFACSDSPTPAAPDGELGDIVVGDITVPYKAVEMVAGFVDQPVVRVWNTIYAGLVAGTGSPPSSDGDADPNVALALLEREGIEIPDHVVELVTTIAADEGRTCSLRQYAGDPDDEDAWMEWAEDELLPWNDCIDEVLDEGECTFEELSSSNSEDEFGNKYLHAWCDPQPD